jgi:hypothetical protein
MARNAQVHTNPTRQFIQPALSCAFVGIAHKRESNWLFREASALKTNLSPEAALQELLEGNQRFGANRLTSIERWIVTCSPL